MICPLMKTRYFGNETFPSSLSFPDCVPAGDPGAGRRGMNREGVPGKSPEEMYIQQKVRVLLMLRKMGSNVRCTWWPISCGFSGSFGLTGVVLVEMGR